MAADTIVIDISARFTDDTAAGMGRARNNSDRLGDSIRRTQDQADRFGRTRAQADLSVRDRATSTVERVTGSLRSIGGKTFSFTMKAIDYATKPLRSILNYATSIKGIITGIIAGKAFNTFLRSPMGLADQIESSNIFFEKKLGSAEAGKNMINSIFEFDKRSPFNSMQITQITQGMLAMGFEADNVLEKLEIIGDTAAGIGKGTDGVEGIARALGEMKMKGTLSGQEFLQLTSWGVGGKDYVMKAFGKDYESVNKDIKAGRLTIDEAIDGMLEQMKLDYGGSAAANSDRTIKGIWGQIDSLMESKVKLPFGEGLSEGTKKGLNVMKDLLEKNETKLVKFGETMRQVGSTMSNAFFGTLENGYKRLDKVLGSAEFNNADLAGKMKIMWKEVISNPLDEWWQSNGGFFTQKGQEIAGNIGNGIGSFFKGGIMALMGIEMDKTDSVVSSGMQIGKAFADGFIQGFDVDTVAKAIMAGVKNTAIEASKLLPGGEKAGAGSLLSAGLLFYGGKKMGLGKLFGMAKGLKGATAAGAVGEVAETVARGATKGVGVAGATTTAGKVLKGSKYADDYAEWWAKQNLLKMTTREGATAAHQAGFKGFKLPNLGKFGNIMDDLTVGLLKPVSKVAPHLGKAGKFLKGNALSLLFAGAAIAQADDKVGETAKQTGGFAASLAGAKAGGAAGAAIGTLVGPAGTAVGGAIGGLAGGIGGYMAGEKFTSWLYDKFKKPGEAGEKAGKSVGDMSNKTDLASGKVQDMGYRVDETAVRLATMNGQIDPVTGELLIFANRLGQVNDKLSNIAIPTAMTPMYSAAQSAITPPRLNIGGGIDRDGNPFTPFATGGIVKSRTKAIIGEGGPEAIIPLTNKRRGRSLLQKAGESLGVSTQQTPSINLGGINISVSGGNGTEVMEAIRAQMPEVANELCEYIATALGRSFGNMATGEV